MKINFYTILGRILELLAIVGSFFVTLLYCRGVSFPTINVLIAVILGWASYLLIFNIGKYLLYNIGINKQKSEHLLISPIILIILSLIIGSIPILLFINCFLFIPHCVVGISMGLILIETWSIGGLLFFIGILLLFFQFKRKIGIGFLQIGSNILNKIATLKKKILISSVILVLVLGGITLYPSITLIISFEKISIILLYLIILYFTYLP